MDPTNPENPSPPELLEWVLKKLGEGDFVFNPVGTEGRWELAVYDFGEEPLDAATVHTLRRAVPSMIETFDGEAMQGLAAGPLQLFLGRYLLDVRKQLASHRDVANETKLLEAGSNPASDSIAFACVAEFGGRFPRMLGRLEQLRGLEANQPVPDEVQKYLSEATQCFVNGKFIACLLVCRSAVEFALRHRLEKAGKRRELSILDEKGEAGVDNLIRLARKELSWELGKTLDAAVLVKEAANAALHRHPPKNETCINMFDATRGVLRELFA